MVTLCGGKAFEIVATAREVLKEKGQTACISVYNHMGLELCFSAMTTNVRAFAANIAKLKAEQSAKTGRRTVYLAQQVREGKLTERVLNIPKDEFITFAGGVPIYSSDGELIGGMGVSNLKAEEDEAICIETLERLGYLSDRPE